MQQVRDPAIRLFGQKISRTEDADDTGFSGAGCINIDKEEEQQQYRDGGGGIGQNPEEEKDPIDNEVCLVRKFIFFSFTIPKAVDFSG